MVSGILAHAGGHCLQRCLAGSVLLPSLAAYLYPQVFPQRRCSYQPPPQLLPRSPWPPGPKLSAVIQASGDTRGPVCAEDGGGGGGQATGLSLAVV
jgi:hypothetical protein